MKSRLLIDAKIFKAALPYADDPDDFFVLEADRRIAEAQDKQTHRIDCEELAEWLDRELTKAENPYRLVDALIRGCSELRKGRMPGETK